MNDFPFVIYYEGKKEVKYLIWFWLINLPGADQKVFSHLGRGLFCKLCVQKNPGSPVRKSGIDFKSANHSTDSIVRQFFFIRL